LEDSIGGVVQNAICLRGGERLLPFLDRSGLQEGTGGELSCWQKRLWFHSSCCTLLFSVQSGGDWKPCLVAQLFLSAPSLFPRFPVPCPVTVERATKHKQSIELNKLSSDRWTAPLSWGLGITAAPRCSATNILLFFFFHFEIVRTCKKKLYGSVK